MDIDIKRLEWDAAYWDEIAPSWAKTFIGPCEKGLHYWFDKFSGEGDALCHETGGYRAVNTIKPHAWDIIPRPKPQSQEWYGEGLPPVGCECEVFHTSINDQEWTRAEVVGYKNDFVIYAIETDDDLIIDFVSKKWARPIRTQSEREREELAEIIQSECENHFPSLTRWNEVADAIIAAGWKKERT